MKARFDGPRVILGPEGRSLYEQSGYGRPEKAGLRLAPEEAAYLVQRAKIEIPRYDFDRLLSLFAQKSDFLRNFLVYRDIRERGYAIQTGPHDFRVFKRGQRPGSGRSQYLVRVLSERDLIDFDVLLKEATASAHMRKQHVLAVVDDENELTYYEVKIAVLPDISGEIDPKPLEGILVGKAAIISTSEMNAPGMQSYGMRLDDTRIMLSPLEILYLAGTGRLALRRNGECQDLGVYKESVAANDVELQEKFHVYEDLRKLGYTPRTGYKFGHHFRVYSGQKTHSEMLVHAIAGGLSLPMSTISRSVRLAHSVKKKMLFGCEYSTGIQYVEFARVKL
ncbi:MAG TPA: tRNA-intron lyase [Methanoregulaceae archaeon]|nr:tRNA-intron lyase [Methanoregulaceae archaeon]